MAKAKVRSIVLKLRCDFCGASEDDARLLIAAPSHMLHICDVCVGVCADMVAKEGGK